MVGSIEVYWKKIIHAHFNSPFCSNFLCMCYGPREKKNCVLQENLEPPPLQRIEFLELFLKTIKAFVSHKSTARSAKL